MEWHHDDYLLTDDKGRLDLDAILAMLADTYWAAGRPRAVIAKAIGHSICFGMFHEGRQVGFARGVTDHATFTWICDVIVRADHRGKGLGKWLMQCVLEHPELQTLSQCLRTRDAHALYEPFGFERVEYMRRSRQTYRRRKVFAVGRELRAGRRHKAQSSKLKAQEKLESESSKLLNRRGQEFFDLKF